jgi:phage terminase small subunit
MPDLVAVPDPEMAAEPAPLDGLTPRQSAFVLAYVQNGDGNATRAARDAGYSASSAAVIGYRLLRREDVLRHIHAGTVQALAAHAPVALATMTSLLGARSEFVRQQAASDLLDRAGMKPPERHQHLVGGGLSIDIRLGE